jgi:hypothetical protein
MGDIESTRMKITSDQGMATRTARHDNDQLDDLAELVKTDVDQSSSL